MDIPDKYMSRVLQNIYFIVLYDKSKLHSISQPCLVFYCLQYDKNSKRA